MPLPTLPTAAQIAQLPCYHRATIPDAYRDAMGHMNVRWYMALFDEAGWRLFESIGMTPDYFAQHNAGGFALEQHIRYLAEVLIGETVAIHGRVVGRSAKRIHHQLLMLNTTTGRLAATIEEVGAHADLGVRRMAPFPPAIAERIDALIAQQQALDWPPPLCGWLHA